MGLADPEMLNLMLLALPPLLLGLTVHEFAHARTALQFGDPTAKLMGRVSLNPLVHLDPVGTLVLVLTQMVGWAKPVPVNMANLRPWPLGMIAVSAAGPLSNVALALLMAAMAHGVIAAVPWLGASTTKPLLIMLFIGVQINLALAIFNLIPLYPLDGHHILRGLLPYQYREPFMHWQRSRGMLCLGLLVFMPRLVSRITDYAMPDPFGMVRYYFVDSIMKLLGLGG